MSAYKIKTTVGNSAATERVLIVAEVPEHVPHYADGYTLAETIARTLSGLHGGRHWITSDDSGPEPLTSFTGGQRDHQATAGQRQDKSSSERKWQR
jgi:hypothetical protein